MTTDNGLKIGLIVRETGIDRMKECSGNLKFTLQQLSECIEELNECAIDIKPEFRKLTGCLNTSSDYVDQPKDDSFGTEDVDDMISDLQEEYYRLGKGNILIKLEIINSIDRLFQLREMMKE